MKAIAVALALLDFAPLFLLSLGLFFLAQLVDRLDPRCRIMALSGFALVTIGGLARAISNLALPLLGGDLPLLSTSFYVFAGPGFAIMAGALIRAHAASRGRVIARDPWLLPTGVSWAFLLAALYASASSEGGGQWRRVLVTLALSGWVATGLATAALGWSRQLHMAAGLLVYNIGAISLFVALRLLAPQSLLMQSFGELLNLTGQAAFAFASWRVAAEYQARIGPIAPP